MSLFGRRTARRSGSGPGWPPGPPPYWVDERLCRATTRMSTTSSRRRRRQCCCWCCYECCFWGCWFFLLYCSETALPEPLLKSANFTKKWLEFQAAACHPKRGQAASFQQYVHGCFWTWNFVMGWESRVCLLERIFFCFNGFFLKKAFLTPPTFNWNKWFLAVPTILPSLNKVLKGDF